MMHRSWRKSWRRRLIAGIILSPALLVVGILIGAAGLILAVIRIFIWAYLTALTDHAPAFLAWSLKCHNPYHLCKEKESSPFDNPFGLWRCQTEDPSCSRMKP